MDKLRKYLILTVAFVVPVLIYLFLKLFGQNYYALPVYYQDETVRLEKEGCAILRAPHTVAFIDEASFATVIVPLPDGCENCTDSWNELRRIQQRHDEVAFNFITDKPMDCPDALSNCSSNYLSSVDLVNRMRCDLVMDIPMRISLDSAKKLNRWVLVDSYRKIRGYYEPNDREEIDRLILELTILKQEGNVAREEEL
ncbi:MAG: hypothetical protein RJQ09_10075 [Cyclobacteriaceae bacterium]